MPTWLVHEAGIKWSYYRNKLYFGTMKSGLSHNELHVQNSIPLTGSQFDLVERGRAAAFKMKGTGRVRLTIEAISTGGKEHLSNAAVDAVLEHFNLKEEDIDLELLDPSWDSQAFT